MTKYELRFGQIRASYLFVIIFSRLKDKEKDGCRYGEFGGPK